MKYKIFTSILIAILSCRAPLPAADDSTIRTSFRSIGFGVDIDRISAGLSPSVEPFSVQSFQLGSSVDYTGPWQVTFYRTSLLKTLEEGTVAEQVPTPLAQVEIDPTWKKTLLIWSGREGSYSVLAIPDDNASFPENHIRFVNLTPGRIGILTTDDEKQITLPKDDWVINANGREAVYFTAMLEGSNDKVKQINNVVEMRPDFRRTVFFAIANYAEMGGNPDGSPQFSYFVLTER